MSNTAPEEGNGKVALIIEDNPADADLVQELSHGCLDLGFLTATTLQAGRTLLLETEIHVVFLDLFLPDSEGLNTVRAITGEFPSVPVVVMTGIEDEKVAIEAVRTGVEDYLVKGDLTPELIRRTTIYAMERHNSKQAFWAERTNFTTVIDNHPDANLLVDNGIIIYANPASSTILGKPMEETIGSELDLPLGDDPNAEVDIHRSDGSLIVAEMRAIEVSLNDRRAHLVVLRDISHQRHAQLVVRQLERTHCLGHSIEYLLHEMNNPLGALLSYLKTADGKFERLVAKLEDRSKGESGAADPIFGECLSNISLVRRSMKGAHQAGTRLQTSLSTLRKARRNVRTGLPSTTYLSTEVDLAIAITTRSYGHKVDIRRTYKELPAIKVEPLRMAEVFCALLRNGIEAIEDVDGGHISIDGFAMGGETMVTIDDNGLGISKNLRDKIFMPFFTTKKKGSSVGLGLTLARDVVKELGGDITASSSPTGGARFTVYLPSSKRTSSFPPIVPEQLTE